MKTKLKTTGRKIPIKKPSTAKERTTLKQGSGRSPQPVNRKNDLNKNASQKAKTNEASKKIITPKK